MSSKEEKEGIIREVLTSSKKMNLLNKLYMNTLTELVIQPEK